MNTTEQNRHDEVRAEVRARYAEAARAVVEREDAACCGPGDEEDFGARRYAAGDAAGLPGAALLASLGCGNPTAVAELLDGETVLDLGSGGGIDVLLSARRVGPTGRAYGLDMTGEMLDLARRNAADAGATNVEFLHGHIEAIPLPAATIDVVISNCVINLSPDKPAVLAEMFRVLRPGGRVGVSDVVAEDRLSPAERAESGAYVGCIAGALSKDEYERGLAAAGFTDVRVTFTHPVADGLHGAIVQATKPPAAASSRTRQEPGNRITVRSEVAGGRTDDRRDGWAPEACTLPAIEQPLRLAEFDELFATALRAQERVTSTRLRWTLDPAAEGRARDLAARESGCCSFFTFTFTSAGARLHLDVQVPAAPIEILDALAARAAAAAGPGV